MSQPGKPPRSLDGRLILLGAIILLISLPLLFDLFQRQADPFGSSGLEGSTLWILLAVTLVAALVLLAAVVRTAVRLWMKRRHFDHGVFGSLWTTIYGASLIALALWLGVGYLMIKALERAWSDPAVQTVLTQGNALAQSFANEVEQTTARDVRLVADATPSNLLDQSPTGLGTTLRGLRERFELDYLALYEGRELVHAVLDPQAGIGTLPEPGTTFLDNVAAAGEGLRMPPRQRGRLVIAGRRLTETDPPSVLLVGNVLEPHVVDQRRSLLESYQGLRRLELDKEKWLVLGYGLLLLLGLLGPAITFLIARAVGDHFDRSVDALERATDRLAQGDLEHRIDTESEDELGRLTARFNAMADELEARGLALSKAHAETQTERALARAVNEGVASGVIAVDNSGLITVINRAARELLALGSEPVLDQSVRDILTARGLDEIADIAEGADGSSDRQEIRAAVGGRWKMFAATRRELVDTEGHHSGRVVVLEDLTDLIQAKESGAWRDAARKVAHEIRNPLTPIQLSAERLKRKAVSGDADLAATVQEASDTIVDEVQTMKRMVDEFSQYARLPAPNPVPTDVDELLQTTARFYRDIKPGVNVVAQPNGQIDDVLMDSDQMRRVLNNLVENAVDAVADTGEPGTVTLAAHPLEGDLVIEVKDDGVGLTQEQKSRMFLPHFSTKRRGSGLGLAIAERIVSEHRGHIDVRDNQPHGTVVSVVLPRN